MSAMSVVFVAAWNRRFREHVIHRQEQAEFAGACLVEQAAREIELVVFDERLPHRQPLRFQKRVGHRAADQHRIGKLHQVLYDLDLVGHFCAAQDGDERPLGIRNRLAEIRQFLFHQQARRGLAHKPGDADDRGVSAMRGAKGIAHEELIAQSRKLLRELRVVRLFLGVIPDILEEQHFPISKRLAFRFRIGADAIGSERHRLAEHFAEFCGYGRETVLRINFSFWPAQMRSKDEPRSAFDGQAQRGQRFADTRVVGNAATIERNVEIHADENALAAQFKVANGKFAHDRGSTGRNRNSRAARQRI